jgi:hypothetical protein
MANPTVKVPKTIPQDVKCDLIALAILQGQFLESGLAFIDRRAKIERRMPGASRLADDDLLIQALVEEHNASVRS